MNALSQGVDVRAKVSWLTQSSRYNHQFSADDDVSMKTADTDSIYESRPRYIHCTPLMGSDSKPGVIMIVMVDREDSGRANTDRPPLPTKSYRRQDLRNGDCTEDTWPATTKTNGGDAAKFSGNLLYADYLRQESKSVSKPERRRMEAETRISSVDFSVIPGIQSSGRSSPIWRTPSRMSSLGASLMGVRDSLEENRTPVKGAEERRRERNNFLNQYLRGKQRGR
jgi:hypothetical protein